MKKNLLSIILFLFSFTVNSQTKIYVNYVTHNEDNYTQYVTNQSFYVSARTMLRQFAIDCKNKGAKWSMGNDFRLLDAVAAHDLPPVTSNTNGLNLLKWMQDNMDVELDPHAHAQPGSPSLADVAYKHTQLGVEPSSVISGYLYNELDGNNNIWYDYENPVQSNINSSYYYHPEILWGAAVPGHTDDPNYFGIWKPQDPSNYYIHDLSKRMINYGNGCRIKITNTTTVEEVVSAVDDIINGIKSGDYPSTGFYQISIFMSEYFFWDTLVSPPNTYDFSGDFLNKVNAITDSINVRVNQNTMEWMHIEDIVNEWKTTYGSDPFFVSCDQEDVLSANNESLPSETFSVFPNPATEIVYVSLENNTSEYKFFLYNLSGKLIDYQDHKKGAYSFSTKGLPKGVYLIEVLTKDSSFTSKIIIN